MWLLLESQETGNSWRIYCGDSDVDKVYLCFYYYTHTHTHTNFITDETVLYIFIPAFRF